MPSLEPKIVPIVPGTSVVPIAPVAPAASRTPAVSRARARSSPLSERLFFGGCAAFVAGSVFAGFWRSYFLRGHVALPVFGVSPLSLRIHVHAFVFLGWILAFITQVALVGAGRRDLHKKLGLVAVVWIPLLVGVGVWTSLNGPPVPFMEARGWLAVTLADLVLFAGLAVAALRTRRDLQTHKRLMLLATITLLPASVGRWPLPEAAYFLGVPASFFALADLAILPLVAWDLVTRGHIHRATLWGGLCIVSSLPIRFAVATSSAWLAIADGALSLVR